MPANFQNVLFTGGAMTLVEGNQYVGPQTSTDVGMNILYDHASSGALHNSGERFDPPKCHPNTRVALQEEILNWLNDDFSEHTTMWMKGPMGAGKSAIAQAIAQICYERRQLSSTFFFARASDSGRNDEKKLVATLAYQMSMPDIIPETRPFISSTLLANPLILDSSLKSQLEGLILGPLSSIEPLNPEENQPRLIIIDGLDECMNEDAQALIVKVFVTTIARKQRELQMPHKLLITSRPESKIEAAFLDPSMASFVRQLPLDNSWCPDEDIRKFLLGSFAEIKRTHPIGNLIPADWPPSADIDRIVEKSSGQFIYASVVVKFIQSHRNHPIHSLSVILGLVKDSKSRPYAELDALYTHIFSKVNNIDLVLRIFNLRLAGIWLHDDLYPLTCDIIEAFLGLPVGMVKVALNDLASLVLIDNGDCIVFLHASLSEFLEDKTRSSELYVNGEKICQPLANRCLEIILLKPTSLDDIWHHSLALIDIAYFANRLNPDARDQIYKSISNMDLMRYIETFIMMFGHNHQHITYLSAASFIRLVVVQDIELSRAVSVPTLLEKAVGNIRKWLQTQFKAFPFNGFDNNDGLDFWIFAAMTVGEHVLSCKEQIIQAAEFSMKPKDTAFKISDIDKYLTPSVEVCWTLIHFLTRGDDSLDFLKEYSFSGDRYSQAALRACRNLFDLVPDDYTSYHRDAIDLLLSRATPNEELYALLKPSVSVDAFPHLKDLKDEDGTPVMPYDASLAREFLWRKSDRGRDYDTWPKRRTAEWVEAMARAIDQYVQKTREAFPDIDDRIKELVEEDEPKYEQSKKRKRSQTSRARGRSKRIGV